MLTKAAYVVWVSSALKLTKKEEREIKNKKKLPTFLAIIFSPSPPPSSVPHPFLQRILCLTFLPMAPFGLFGGGGSKILCCCCGGRVEYRGMIFISPTWGPRSSTSRLILLQASSISWKKEHKNRAGSETPGLATAVDGCDRGKKKRTGPGKPWFPATVHLF